MTRSRAFAVLVLLGGAIVLSPSAASDAGSICRPLDVSCCQHSETGPDLVRCIACVLALGYWDPAGNRCIVY